MKTSTAIAVIAGTLGVVIALSVAFFIALTSDDNHAVSFCTSTVLDRAQLDALKEGEPPGLTIKETDGGRELQVSTPIMGICEQTCGGTLSDEGFKGTLNLKCLGISTSTTRLEIGH